MFHFFKKIWSLKSDKQKIVLPKQEEPDSGEIYFFNRIDLLKVLIPYTLIVIFLFSLIFTLTPVGNIVPSPEDREVRNQVIEIHQRLANLRDTIQARDMQLEAFKTALREGRSDTTFAVELPQRETTFPREVDKPQVSERLFSSSSTVLRPEDIILSTDPVFRELPDFPTEFPVNGTLTRGFLPDSGHFGIDVATSDGEIVRSVAPGMVIFDGFTIRYGYVIIIRHNDNFISVYKHCSSLAVESGTFVHAGQVIGRVGLYGTLTTGPHLHFELWKNLVPVDPLKYFTNLAPDA